MAHRNFIQQTISNTPGTSGNFTLSTAVAGWLALEAGDDGESFSLEITEAGLGSEARTGCVYTHSGPTLARGTLEKSTTGAAINFTSAAIVSVVATAHLGNLTELSTKGTIQGLEISYSSATAIAVAAGTCAINGKLLSYAGGTLTSGSTWKNNNNSTVTVGASKCYYVYAFDNAGILEIRVQDFAEATYGGAPTWDVVYGYWKAPSVGAQARRIGKFWTDGSSNTIKFVCTGTGRTRRMEGAGATAITINTNLTSTSFTATGFTVTPFVTSDDIATKWLAGVYKTTTGPDQARIDISVDAGTSPIYIVRSYSGVSANYMPPAWTPASTAPQYRVFTGDTGQCWLCGVEYFV